MTVAAEDVHFSLYWIARVVMPGRHQQAPGTPSGSAVVTLCHFLHIWGWAGIADRTVWEGPEPVLCRTADEFDHLGNETAE
jgi:hypothetical protein